ncbi:MAG TPA: hypothetical protein VJV03_08415 [Pyrinomonadaceae bacterium]|nr:hypothetical protein [Pyrinomonadaceae bacterium]
MAKTGHNGHNGHGRGHVTEVPDVSYIKNVDVTHEASDVSVGGLLKFVLALSVMTAMVALLMWGLFRFFNQQEIKRETPKGPMAMTEAERLPPEPRLQSAKGFGVKLEDGEWVPLELSEPQAEFRVLREQWLNQLHCQQDPHGITEHRATPEQQATDQHATDQHATDRHATTAQPVTRSQPCVPIDAAMKQLVQQGLPSRPEKGMAVDTQLPTAASSGRQSSGGSSR